MAYATVIGQTRYSFDTLKALLAKATPERSGDQLAGVAAEGPVRESAGNAAARALAGPASGPAPQRPGRTERSQFPGRSTRACRMIGGRPRRFKHPELAYFVRCSSSRALASRSRQPSSRPRSASARAATSKACKVVRSDATSLSPPLLPEGAPRLEGVTSGIVGIRLAALGGGAITDRSSVCGGAMTPPERPSSSALVPGGRLGVPRSGAATGGSVATPWRSAIWRT